MSRNDFNVSVVVGWQTVADLLVTAVETPVGGWWLSFDDVRRDADGNILQVLVRAEHSTDDRLVTRRLVTLQDMATAIGQLGSRPESGLRRHMIDALGDHDAITADVVLQMAVYGDVIFG